MAQETFIISQAFLQRMIRKCFQNEQIYLGIITLGNEVATSLVNTPSGIFAVEYNASGWTRPMVQPSTSGAYNTTAASWGFDISWPVSSTVSLSIKQSFLVASGNNTPRNTSGDFLGMCQHANPIIITPGTTKSISLATLLKGL